MAETKRQTLKIVSVEETKEFPRKDGTKGTKRQFKATDSEGKTLTYQVFTSAFDEFIREGITIEADTQTDEKETESGLFINRKVVQVYVGGQPIKARSTGQYQGRGYDSASIEAQTAYKGIVELLVAKILTIDHHQAQAALNWAATRLAPPKPIEQPKEIPKEKGPLPKEEKPPVLPRPPTSAVLQGRMDYATFEKECERLGLDRQMILKVLNIASLKENWIGAGKTFEEALVILRKTTKPSQLL